MTGVFLVLSMAAAPAAVSPPVPRARLESLVSADDYPVAARAQGLTGTTRVQLEIAPMGRVTACRVLASSGAAVLDAATCRLLSSRGRFTPAMDAAGNPVTGSYETSLTWPPTPAPR